MNEIRVLPASFTTEAEPTSPQWMALLPIAISTGCSSSCRASGPPVMNSRVPRSAPSLEPVTGASSIAAPRSESATATLRASSGEMVEAST